MISLELLAPEQEISALGAVQWTPHLHLHEGAIMTHTKEEFMQSEATYWNL